MRLQDFLHQTVGCANRMNEQEKEMEKIIEFLQYAKRDNQQVFICGNGGSAGTATHMAGDLFKIGGLKAISLDENVPLMTAIINDEGWDKLYTFQLERLFKPGDVLISFSVHGGSGKDKAGLWSQNITKAIDYVMKNGGITIGFSGFDGGSMKEMCHVCMVIPVDSTPIVEAFHVILHHYIAFELQEGDRK